jgi:hypothetical protein
MVKVIYIGRCRRCGWSLDTLNEIMLELVCTWRSRDPTSGNPQEMSCREGNRCIFSSSSYFARRTLQICLLPPIIFNSEQQPLARSHATRLQSYEYRLRTCGGYHTSRRTVAHLLVRLKTHEINESQKVVHIGQPSGHR